MSVRGMFLQYKQRYDHMTNSLSMLCIIKNKSDYIPMHQDRVALSSCGKSFFFKQPYFVNKSDAISPHIP